MLWIQRTLGKHFLHPAGCGSVFPTKRYRDAWRSGHWLAGRWVNMVGEAKLCSPLCSTFEAFVCDVQSAVVMEKIWALSVDQCWMQVLQVFWCISLICWIYFSDAVVSESCSGSNRQQTTKQWLWPFFWCRFGFGASSQSNHWAGCCWLSHKIHLIWPRNGSLLLHKIRWHFKMMICFYFWSVHEILTYWAF